MSVKGNFFSHKYKIIFLLSVLLVKKEISPVRVILCVLLTTFLLGHGVLKHRSVQRRAERNFMFVAGRNKRDISKAKQIWQL